jgi:hypothetical protein
MARCQSSPAGSDDLHRCSALLPLRSGSAAVTVAVTAAVTAAITAAITAASAIPR